MKALQFVGDNKCIVNELPIPEIGDDEVLLASRGAGICHSDIELLAGRYIIPFEFPLIPGHEWSAEVIRAGRSVKSLGRGDHVVGECVIGHYQFGFSISGAAAEVLRRQGIVAAPASRQPVVDAGGARGTLQLRLLRHHSRRQPRRE
jgi:L-iditol 2-dehydrogenase